MLGGLAGISVLAPNSLTQYTPRGVPAHVFSLPGSSGPGHGPACPNPSPEAADRSLPMRFCQTPHRPSWLWVDSSAVTVSLSCRKGQPSYPPYPRPEPLSCQMTLRNGNRILHASVAHTWRVVPCVRGFELQSRHASPAALLRVEPPAFYHRQHLPPSLAV